MLGITILKYNEEFDVLLVLNAMPDEILFDPTLWKNPAPKIFLVPNDYTVPPEDVAEKILQKTEELWGAVFMPGRAFDEKGTRHGRGKGWYDRFLKRIPKELLRAGLSTEESFSESDLVRKSWDEPVDWVLVKAGEKWKFCKTDARMV